MKARSCCKIIYPLALLMLGALVSVPSIGLAELVEWKSVSGGTIEAEFVKMEDGRIVLKTGEGKVMAIAPERLDEASRKMAEQHVAKVEAAKPVAPKGPGALVRHSTLSYDISVYPPIGKIVLMPNAGKESGAKPLEIWLRSYYRTTPKKEPTLRRISGFSKEPEITGSTLRYEVTAEDGVNIAVHAEMGADTFTIGYGATEPADIVYKGIYDLFVMVPDVLEYNQETEMYDGSAVKEPINSSQIQSTMSGLAFTAKLAQSGDKIRYSYNDIPERIQRDYEWVKIDGHYGKGHSIHVQDPGEGGLMRVDMFHGEPFYRGFKIHMEKADVTSSPDSAAGIYKFIFE